MYDVIIYDKYITPLSQTFPLFSLRGRGYISYPLGVSSSILSQGRGSYMITLSCAYVFLLLALEQSLM